MGVPVEDVDALLRALAETDVRRCAMPELLRRAAQTAVQSMACRYAVISVRAPDGRLEQSASAGTEPDAGGAAPASVGSAELHVSITLRGESGGNLVVSGPLGRSEFDDSDHRCAMRVADVAAGLIERARTDTANRRRHRWQTGAADLVKDLVTGAHPHPLRLIAERVLELADADLVAVVQPGPSEDSVVVSAAAGAAASRWDGSILPMPRFLAHRVLDTTTAISVAHVSESAEWAKVVSDGPEIDAALIVPLSGAHGRGLLCIGRAPGRPAFSAAETSTAALFGGQAALALELAETQTRRDQLAIVEERDRIARDLHDHVIQRLFAIGLSMQNASNHLTGAAVEQLRTTVDDIDETIKQIRSSIYRLTGPIVAPRGSVRTRAARLLDELEVVLGFRPRLRFEGPVEFGMDEDLVDDCVAVLREALTNVVRHADAGRVDILIAVTNESVAIEVRDDGCGIGETTRQSGLGNLRARAERRAGSLIVESDGPGTRLRWAVPTAAPDEPPVRARSGGDAAKERA